MQMVKKKKIDFFKNKKKTEKESKRFKEIYIYCL